jgi:hypothetical protein
MQLILPLYDFPKNVIKHKPYMREEPGACIRKTRLGLAGIEQQPFRKDKAS